jgi:hypothetical protein
MVSGELVHQYYDLFAKSRTVLFAILADSTRETSHHDSKYRDETQPLLSRGYKGDKDSITEISIQTLHRKPVPQVQAQHMSTLALFPQHQSRLITFTTQPASSNRAENRYPHLAKYNPRSRPTRCCRRLSATYPQHCSSALPVLRAAPGTTARRRGSAQGGQAATLRNYDGI